MAEPDRELISAQAKLSKSLALGFALSLFPLFGVATLVIGIRAKQAILASQGKLKSKVMLAWCIIVGAIETVYCVVCLLAALALVFNR